MSKKILLLGELDSILIDVQQQVASPNLEYFRGTNVKDIRSVFAQTNIDHVIMGGGIPLETRLEMVRVIFELSKTTSVHMKDVASGGFPPFVRSVLSGLLGATTFIDKIVKYATVTIPTGLEIRAEPTSKSARIGTYPPGLVLSFVEVVNGENVGGNPLWGRIKQGQYVWLGGTDRPNG